MRLKHFTEIKLRGRYLGGSVCFSLCFLSCPYRKYQAALQRIERTLQSLAGCQAAVLGQRDSKDEGSLASQADTCDARRRNNGQPGL